MSEKEKQLRLQRRNAKAKLTRLVNGMDLLIVQERPVHEVNEYYSKVSEAYEAVQSIHDQLVSEMENEDEFLKQERWMDECQENFLKISITQKDYCSQRENNKETPVPDSGTAGNNPHRSTINMPTDNVPDPAPDSLVQPALPLPVPGSNAPHLVSSLYGIPKPSLPMFSGGREKDFAMLKMALDSLIGVHPSLTEQYKYQVLLGRLGGNARKLTESFMHETTPYSSAIQALMEKYGQPRQLVQSELGRIMQTPAIKFSDHDGFENFALTVNSLVGMLKSLEGGNGFELKCGSHVDRLISKLPPSYRDRFVEYCITSHILEPNSDKTYNLIHLAEWLQVKARALRISHQASDLYRESTQRTARPKNQPSTSSYLVKEKPKAFCPYCNGTDHFLGGCQEFRKFSTDDIIKWIQTDKRCWKCGRTHHPDKCTLKRPCNNCKDLHLTVLHDAIQKGADKPTPSVTMYIDKDRRPYNVMLKIVPVNLYGPNGCIETYAVLDDGSMRTIILDEAVNRLDLAGERDEILLTTVRQEPTQCIGRTVTFEISAAEQPSKRYQIQGAFTSPVLRLSDYSYPVQSLQSRWAHLRGLQLPDVCNARPLILVGSDNANLILPQEPVKLGPSGSPAAVRTKLGWTLQGPSSLVKSRNESCNFITTAENNQLLRDVQRLWQVDTLPYTRQAVRSKQDQKALELLEERIIRVDVDGVLRYATPLLRMEDGTQFNADQQSIYPNLKRTERHLQSKPELVEIHDKQINQLVEAGFVKKISEAEANESKESWYIPHHIVEHNGKHRLVFNCSYEYEGKTLNKHLLPGPTIGSTLLGVSLRFRQHPIAISGDIKAMFHQIRLLPEDKPLLRFLWRDLEENVKPTIHEWQVLPFGTTCSPCCASFALKKHVTNNKNGNEEVLQTLEDGFYVDNCLHSVPTAVEAKKLIQKLRSLLAEGGFNIRQWASNDPEVVEHLPSDAKSENYELSITSKHAEKPEPMLGLRWRCGQDQLHYNYKPIPYDRINLRNVYKVLASQYDPLGYLSPFTARAKILVQDLWKNGQDWDTELDHGELKRRWCEWERELRDLPLVILPRCYTPSDVDTREVRRQLHIFCDASERVYGSVAYLRTQTEEENIHVSFVMARTRVAPKRQLSMPRLELCAALSGAELAGLLVKELSFPIESTHFWSDSTTVLRWLDSESCRYKVFVGTRISEIQTITNGSKWSYVNTQLNPADDLTRGKTLKELAAESRWRSGPSFLLQPSDQWPDEPLRGSKGDPEEVKVELKKTTFCGAVETPALPDPKTFDQLEDLIMATKKSLDGAADVSQTSHLTADEFGETEEMLYRQVQKDCFPEELKLAKAGKNLPSNSRLLQFDVVYDDKCDLLRIGGRLRKADILEEQTKHPIILDPHHYITRLVIKSYDHQLHHPGPERVLAEIRRRFWITRGREAIRRHQRECVECRTWRAKPVVPKMSDLPYSRLQLFKPAFYSTGVDCFGPMTVSIGRRSEKRWGVIFKCMTTRAIHLDLLESLDTDAFLMAFRRFIPRRGKPFEILSDCGTNFKGADKELKESFNSLSKDLEQRLARQQVRFRFNPPQAPHFGGTWEREIKSVKNALKVALGAQRVTEAVLRTILIEVEGILNSKPFGYVSSDERDINPVTPNVLLMGRHDPALPQVIYSDRDLLTRKRWRHSQVLADHFWKHFIKYYLPTLQPRQKWTKEEPNLAVRNAVMIVDPQSPRAEWKVGRVAEVFPDDDGRVRTVKVEVDGHYYTRPVVKVVQLPELKDN